MSNQQPHTVGDTTETGGRAIDIVHRGLARRYRSERRFRRYGQLAVVISLSFLALLFVSIIGKGYSAFVQTFVQIDIHFDPEILGDGDLSSANYQGLVKASLQKQFPQVTSRGEKRELYGMVSDGAAYQIRTMILDNPELIGTTRSVWVPVDDDIDMLAKGHIDRDTVEADRRINDRQLAWFDQWQVEKRIKKRFNKTFFTSGDSREPELAGIQGAMTGSFFTMIVTLLLAFPVGVATAVYLEEFAPRNRWVDLVEVNVNNLAAVPSIVFGLLGLAIFINFFGLPRSASLVGGLVLTLMTLPIIIIASRASLQSVPPSIREAALGVGASKMQTVLHHVFPLALPGMLTGTIIGMSRALGETAPLLMIGMVAFIVDIPRTFFDPATALPVQIYLWADSPERAFVERTSAAIMVLLAVLIAMNLLAVVLRNRFERRW
jgi:phosphate transport system permease protein